MIAIALAELNQIKPFPGWWAIVPVGGATLLIAAGPMATLNRHLLANRLAIGIGLISYPLYLWHWPLLTFLRLVSPHSIGALPRLAAIGAAVLAAIATYYLVESPLRRGKISFFRTAILFVLVAGLGLFGFAASELLWPSRHADRGLTRIVNAMHDWAYPPIGFRGFYHDALRFYRKDWHSRQSHSSSAISIWNSMRRGSTYAFLNNPNRRIPPSSQRVAVVFQFRDSMTVPSGCAALRCAPRSI